MKGNVTNTPKIVIKRKEITSQCIISALKRDKYLWLMLVLPILYYGIFCYGPMYGLVIAFEKYSPYRGMLGGPWVGLKWFNEFFQSIFFLRLIKNTLLINIYNLIFGFPAPILLALFINEINLKWFKKTAQTISYLPHFISTVIVVGITVNFLSPSSGIVNVFLGMFGIQPINFMIMPQWFRTIYVTSSIWQEIGWGSIIYLAALSGVDPQLYEAAEVDGASKFQQKIHVTIPGIMPTIVIMLILSMGNMLSIGAEKVLLLYNPLTYETGDVISTYIYRVGIGNSEFSFGTAVGLFQSIINFILIILVNKISRKLSETSLW